MARQVVLVSEMELQRLRCIVCLQPRGDGFCAVCTYEIEVPFPK